MHNKHDQSANQNFCGAAGFLWIMATVKRFHQERFGGQTRGDRQGPANWCRTTVLRIKNELVVRTMAGLPPPHCHSEPPEATSNADTALVVRIAGSAHFLGKAKRPPVWENRKSLRSPHWINALAPGCQRNFAYQRSIVAVRRIFFCSSSTP